MNKFIDCEIKTTIEDIKKAESYMGKTIPASLTKILLQNNGGTPVKNTWEEPLGDFEPIVINEFISIKYYEKFEDDIDFLLEGISKNLWGSGEFPNELIPFAIDDGGNYFCINTNNEKIYYYTMDIWNDRLSKNENFKINTRIICDDIDFFIDNLSHEENQ